MNTKQKKQSADLIGWYGAAAVLTAYLLITTGVLSAHALLYQGLNISGSAAIIYEAGYKKDRPVELLNVAWLIIGIVGLVQIVYSYLT